MAPKYTDYVWVVEQIASGIPIGRLRQDLVYELFRRGILDVDSDNRLYLSAVGHAISERIKRGEHIVELD